MMEFLVTQTSDRRGHARFISFVSLEEFMAWVKEQGDVIVKPIPQQTLVELEIYDTYRE